ncbi:MAG: hypothetical protein KGN36_16645, partial [Acidobacteriota bacterium]|nr:hypothetical protein [Acidobacteriota bacterium]
RQPAGRKLWTSSPVRVLALVFSPRVEDARLREALALSVDRAAIHAVLLQRQGEVSGALLPQWLTGYAFLFPTAQDLPRARALAANPRPLTIAPDDPAARAIAERIALNARDAGITLTVTTQPASADLRLTGFRVASADPAKALAAMAAALGAPEPARLDSAEALFNAERALLDGFKVIPLLHLPDVYGAAPRVRGGAGVSSAGEWQFDNLWLDVPKP